MQADISSTTSPADLQAETYISHVSSHNNCYTSESITFYTFLHIAEDVSEAQLRITVPKGIRFIDASLPGDLKNTPVSILDEDSTSKSAQSPSKGQFLIWVFRSLKKGQVYPIETHYEIEPVNHDQYHLSIAELTLEKKRYKETLALNVRSRGRYLRFLPEIYAEDDLMGRFLMAFESYWAPIERQIKDIAYTFDPKLTPPAFLPWLGSWLGMELSESVSVERMRKLVQVAVFLNRARGTRQALQDYLELYSGGQVHIVEHRANDFRLGSDAELGPNIALGYGNRPHTFTVYLQLPATSKSAGDRLALEKFRREIEMIIDEQKPAHTQYKLFIEVDVEKKQQVVLSS